MAMDHILTKYSGTSDWTISVGTNFTTTAIIYCMIIILFELIAYIILFKQMHTYNQELESKKLGLSKESLYRRRRRNIISFVGEFVSFLIEIIFCTFVQLVVVYNSANHFSGFTPILGMVVQSALTIVFFMASPELKRFYFDYN